jgi:hypothetical protein
MARTECVVCGIGFGAEDLVDGDGAPHCPRCFALVGAGARGRGGAEVDRAEAPESAEGEDRFTAESLEAMAAGGAEPVEGGTAAAAGHGETGTVAEAEAEPRGVARFVASVREWAAGRNWWVRAPVLLWMAWILVHYWDAPWYSTIFHGIDLAIHEIGHVLWAPFGEFLGFAGGTLTQLLAPAVAGIVFVRQRDWFAVSFAICWLGINCFEIVEYAGDALTRQLPLVSPSTAMPIHDWAYMLGQLGILHHTDTVAGAWQWAGRVTMTAGIAFGAWVLWEMGKRGRRTANSEQRTANN